MIRTFIKQLLSATLSVLLIFPVMPGEAAGQQPAAPPAGSPEYPGQGAPLSADELQQLVAPIALYPDALVAQILGAATFPDQVAAADVWLRQNKNLTGTALMQAVDKQPWDPSVKALTQFPSVLDKMTENLSWTSAMGEAYHTQAANVMSAVQVLRAKAKAAGNLKSGSQITVVQQSPQVIVIQPTNPQVVYVPQYNPTVVYGTPVTTPGYSSSDVVAASILAFGVGIAVGAAMNNSCCGWGYSYWNCNWHGGTVVYRSNVYYGNNAWHGGYYGSSATAYGPYGTTTAGRGYNPTTGTYARGGTASTAYGSASAGQAYNPYTGASARGATASTAYGSAAAGQAYNPSTGAYGATRQGSNASGNYGSSVYSKNGQAAYTQHQTTAQGSVGTVQTTTGAKGVAATGANGNTGAVGQTANGNKYAASSSGNVYQNTGGGWQQTQGTPHQSSASSYSGANSRGTSSYSGANSAAARGYGGQERSSGASAFGGGGGGWESRQESARGSASRGGGGGWGGGGRRR